VELQEPCGFLPWDTAFFGKRIAQVNAHRLSSQMVDGVLEWCATHAIECIYLLADSDHAETVRLAEEYGFRLVDIRITLQCNTRDARARSINDFSQRVRVRPARQSDAATLKAIARTSYNDSRFYFDPCFPAESCAALYETWIERSCEDYADVVLVAEVNDQSVGYVSCHLPSNTQGGQIGLVGVESRNRSYGVGQTLIQYSLRWFCEHGVEEVKVVTQGRNIAAQRLFQSCGFLTHSVQLWYHKWFSGCAGQVQS